MAEYYERNEKQFLLNEAQFNAFYSLVSSQSRPDAHGRIAIDDVIFCQPVRALKRGVLPLGQVKIRSYGVKDDSDTVYFELKTPVDNAVFKRRIPVSYKAAKMFLKGYEVDELKNDRAFKEIEYVIKRGKLYPSRYITRDRIAFDGKNWRVTFDANIRYRDYDLDIERGREGERVFPPRYYLATIRSNGTLPAWLSAAAGKLSADESSAEMKARYEMLYYGKAIEP